MEQELLKNGCLRIFISDRELEAFGLSFSSLDIHTEQTQRFLTAVLLHIKAESGFDASRLTIEALPVEGGCLLLLTPAWAPPRRLRLRKNGSPLIYAVPNADALMELAAGWRRLYPPPSRLGSPLGASSLYAFGNGYRLVVYPVAPLSRRAQALLAEWGNRVGSGDAVAAFTAEHGAPLCVGDALSRLCP